MPQPTLLDEPKREPETPGEPGLVRGRPIEDRSFEAVETTVGVVVGLAIGSAVAGPAGAAVGAAVGGAAGLAGGEILERAEGRAARSTDATRETPPKR